MFAGGIQGAVDQLPCAASMWRACMCACVRMCVSMQACACVCVCARVLKSTHARRYLVLGETALGLVPSYVSFEVRSVHARP